MEINVSQILDFLELGKKYFSDDSEKRSILIFEDNTKESEQSFRWFLTNSIKYGFTEYFMRDPLFIRICNNNGKDPNELCKENTEEEKKHPALGSIVRFVPKMEFPDNPTMINPYPVQDLDDYNKTFIETFIIPITNFDFVQTPIWFKDKKVEDKWTKECFNNRSEEATRDKDKFDYYINNSYVTWTWITKEEFEGEKKDWLDNGKRSIICSSNIEDWRKLL